VTLQLLSDLNHVLKEDADVELNVSKTVILSRDISQEGVFDIVQGFITSNSTLVDLTGDISLVSFIPEGFVQVELRYTDSVIQKFVVNTCRVIIDDVDY
jgi:hypothetical protein